MRRRAWAVAEIALVLASILVIIWVAQPQGLDRLDLALRIVIGAWLFATPWIHHDSRQRLGLRVDNFLGALAAVSPMSALAGGVACVAGFLLGTINPPENPAGELAYYFMWASAQQYALQSVIFLRLEDAGLRRSAPLVAAALFAAVHAPNPGLLILTFLGGLLWCSTFRRRPNILAVALSHAILAVVIMSTLPPNVTARYRIGPAYFTT